MSTTTKTHTIGRIGNGKAVHLLLKTEREAGTFLTVLCGAARTTNYSKAQAVREVEGTKDDVTCGKCIRRNALSGGTGVTARSEVLHGAPDEVRKAQDAADDLRGIVENRDDKAARNAAIVAALDAGSVTAKQIADALGIEARAVNEAAARFRARQG